MNACIWVCYRALASVEKCVSFSDQCVSNVNGSVTLPLFCSALCLGSDWRDALSCDGGSGPSQAPPRDVLGGGLHLPASRAPHSHSSRLCQQQSYSGEPGVCV